MALRQERWQQRSASRRSPVNSMSQPGSPSHPIRQRWLRDGGWIMFAGMAVTLIGVLYQLWLALDPAKPKPVGDGVTVESYGFDLSSLEVDPNFIVASGMPKDVMLPLTDPTVLTVKQAKEADPVSHY